MGDESHEVEIYCNSATSISQNCDQVNDCVNWTMPACRHPSTKITTQQHCLLILIATSSNHFVQSNKPFRFMQHYSCSTETLKSASNGVVVKESMHPYLECCHSTAVNTILKHFLFMTKVLDLPCDRVSFQLIECFHD